MVFASTILCGLRKPMRENIFDIPLPPTFVSSVPSTRAADSCVAWTYFCSNSHAKKKTAAVVVVTKKAVVTSNLLWRRYSSGLKPGLHIHT